MVIIRKLVGVLAILALLVALSTMVILFEQGGIRARYLAEFFRWPLGGITDTVLPIHQIAAFVTVCLIKTLGIIAMLVGWLLGPVLLLIED